MNCIQRRESIKKKEKEKKRFIYIEKMGKLHNASKKNNQYKIQYFSYNKIAKIIITILNFVDVFKKNCYKMFDEKSVRENTFRLNITER